MSRDVRRELEEAGRRAAPDPDPAFTDALDARLRAIAASTPPASPRRRRATRSRWPVGVLAAGLAAAALAAFAVLGGHAPAPSPSAPALELTASVNVVVQLADGTTIQNPDGLYLPDGATVTVGDGGSAQIGDVVLQAGEVVLVHNGRVQVQQPASVGSGHGSQGSAGSSGSSRTPVPTSRTSGAPASGQPGPTPSRTATTPTPHPTAPPTAPPTPRTTPPPTPGPTPTPSPSPVPSLRFRASLVSGSTISVAWKRIPGARSYVLVVTRSRTGIAPRPVYPGGRTLGVFAHPPATALRFKFPAGVVQVKLLLVALDRNGNVLMRSRIIRLNTTSVVVAIPPTPASATPSPSPSPSPSLP